MKESRGEGLVSIGIVIFTGSIIVAKKGRKSHAQGVCAGDCNVSG